MKVRPGLVAAYLLGLAPPLCEALWPALELVQGRHAPFVLLVATFALAYPRSEPVERPAQSALYELLWLAPPLGLALGLDLARGLAPLRATFMTLGLAALCLGWSALAAAAARVPAARARYRDLWLLLGPGLAALALALSWVPRGAGDGRGARLFSASPLVLAQRAALPGGAEACTAFEFVLAFLVLALAALGTRRALRGGAA